MVTGKKILIVGVALITGAAIASDQPTIPSAALRMPSGYLKRGEGPDSGKLLPPPPAEGTKAYARDKKGEARALKLQATPRFAQAKIDADIFVPDAIGVMSCAAGRVLGATATPKTSALLRKAGTDFGLSSYPAKSMYKRARPFMTNGKPVCTPDMEKLLRSDGSYPSGHAAIGFGWGMVLADVMPARRAALLKRGAAFADSRRICNVHFLSDIAAGETLAKAVIEKLRTNEAYLADVTAARAELAATPAIKPNCVSENRALRIK